jgi:hypothetical protein
MMFRNNNGAAAEASPDVTVSCDHPVPLSVLELDLGQAPVGGWAAYLADRGVELVLDDIGRLAVARQDARALLAEKREDEQRRREAVARQEQRLIDADEARRATIWKGMPADQIPDGVTAVQLWQQEEHERRPRRTSPLEEALAGETLTFHPYGPDGES